MNIQELGQVFTPVHIVKKMLSLRQNTGRILDPASGDGVFLSVLGKNAVGVEIDSEFVKDKRVICCDFFDYPAENKFNTIIGNPPYVRFQDIRQGTKSCLDMDLFDNRSNLYLFFINKCIDHLQEGGELIFITPRDFIKATSSRKLNHRLYYAGSITHYYELGDKQVFKDASPNCAIWRWEKGRAKRRMVTGGSFCYNAGQIWFGKKTKSCLGNYFDIKVGAVSGADDVFVNDKEGSTDMVGSATAKNGKTKRVIYNREDPSLLKHKNRLMNRRIRKFDESNWWEWGRKYHEVDGERIYVNAKTRNQRPFFISDVKAYDGSVLALFPKISMDMGKIVNKLNNVDWESLGFVCDGRYLFTQRSLETSPVEL